MVDAADVLFDVGVEAFDIWVFFVKLRTLFVVILLGLAGWVVHWQLTLDDVDGASSSQGTEREKQGNGWRYYSVVAPVDTGINVYHDHFQTDEIYPTWLLESLGVTKTCYITLEGSWEERYQADKESCWDNVTTSDIV